MICSKCGKQLEDECLFCTECGSSIGVAEELGKSTTNNKFIEKINNFIYIFGEIKINKYLSIIAIVSMIAIRFFGFIVTSVLITVVNGYLIYYSYKRKSKIDTKMIIWSIAAFFVGLLISL
ncbi:MAG: zinc-ribbon domain-containing protein [Ruminococcaceae bacterium]|nr:zinc-ribbon domain-containing protein [Oscillospiraceae bacterium]